MSEKTESGTVFGEDIKRLPLKDLVKRIGPGLIATGIVIGPGAVTTASMLGADYGYQLMWLFIPIVFMGITFMLTTNRLAIVSGLPTIHAIRKYYGPVASGVVSVAVFLSCLFFTMGNISGTGAGMNLIFGIDWKIGSAIMLAIVLCQKCVLQGGEDHHAVHFGDDRILLRHPGGGRRPGLGRDGQGTGRLPHP